MEILVAYDISTTTPEGERRLREVAKVCEGYGQRVQKSVFECQLEMREVRLLMHDLEKVIDLKSDRVAVYRLREPYRRYVVTLGRGPEVDWRHPVIL
ncbi:CRISPR-associated endonuclease Cas2 [Mycobacterium attenuatum]|uniref:CRISPR-associated endonuclease Cas2 n=1 Tax=Mycobacterium attenuatum TaxID=2341086 RepID=UPI000F0244C6|nr:CRISPR-associated endonuclease Cas2 [Mycobacterium attenuatum]